MVEKRFGIEDKIVSGLLFGFFDPHVNIGDSKTSKRSYVPGSNEGDERKIVKDFS